MNKNNEYIHKELCYGINGCVFEAFRRVGVGFKEINYHKVLHELLRQKGLRAEYKVPLYQEYKGERINTFEIDEIVEDKIVIEVKCIQSNFLAENYAQIITYLKIQKFRLGMLINFGLHKAFTKRVIFDEQRIEDIQGWDDNFIESMPDKNVLDLVLDCIYEINHILGPGYLSATYKKAFIIELKSRSLSVNTNVSIDLVVDDIHFNPVEIDFWQVDNFLLLGILSGKAGIRLYDILRMRSYLNRIGLHHGLICCWTTKNLQVIGVYEP
ncbi:GxxExxY protein [candidate division KSB1 bacterium]|nr:GxxExxY protein [candidate division KSB1 bacterium]